MNFSVNSRRAAVSSLFSLLLAVTPGCVATDTDVEPAGVSVNDGAAGGDSVAANNPETEQVASNSTRSILDRGTAGIGLEISEAPGVNQIAIETSGSTADYNVSRLNNPPRLVIDLPAERVRANKNVPVTDLEFVGGVRVGSHPNKSRIVLDLTNSDVTEKTNVENGKIVVTLTGTGVGATGTVASTSLSADEKVAAIKPELAAPASEEESIVTKDVATLPVETTESIRTEELAADTTGTQSQSPAATTVKQVVLQKGAGTANMVVVDLAGTPDYSITKTAPSEYVLTLRNSELADDVKGAALLAEPQSTGIRSVRSTSDGNDALVRIFAQPETYLTARLNGSTLVVEETKDLALVADDMRAQIEDGDKAAPPAATKENAKAPKAEATPVKAESEPAASKPSGEAHVDVKGNKVATNKGDLSDSELGALLDDSSRYTGRLISLDLQDTDIDNALRIIAEVSNLNIVASDDVTGKVTLRLIDVPWDQALDVILKTNGLDKVLEGNVMRIAPVDKLRLEREALKQAQQAEEELEPLTVKYLRVSYAKAAELKALVETVLSERGSVAYDERSNQLIVKDVRKGLRNVVELVNKIDLRTPQVLLETQIVEASRNLSRELGAELGFQFLQSPATGNGTGLNFPASIGISGSANPANPNSITGSAFPVASRDIGGSAVTFLFDSADATKTLELRLSQLEQEGRVRIISRPAVATTNNKAAEIKSVEKYRVKLPNGGLSVATGSGANANGAGNVATEVIEAGITLNVTPQASPDYFVLLDIHARSSTFGSKEVDGIPNEIERSASSTVLVSSGQTFALGGIYKITDQDRVTGVPFFKDIPVFGHFFRRSIVDNADEELLFFITPRIVEGSFDDASMRAAS